MIIFFYFLDENIIIMILLKKIHIVNDLKVNILIEMNIMIFEKIDIFISQIKTSINNY